MASSPALPWPYAPQMMVPSRFFGLLAGVPLQDALVNLQLVLHHPVDGELPAGFFVDALPKGVAQFLVPGQGQQVLGQLLLVAGLENQPVHAVVDEHRHAPHPGGDGGPVHPGALGQGVGEGLRNGGEQVDVNGVVEGVHVVEPPGKAHLPREPQLFGHGLQLLAVLAVAADEQLEAGLGAGDFHGPQQGGHVLYRGEPHRDARDDFPGLPLHAHAFEEFLLGHRLDGRLKVDAVVDGVNAVRGEIPLDEDVRHGVRHADVEVHPPQGHHVGGAVREPRHRPAQVVQAVVAVHRGDHRGPQVLFNQVAHQVAPGAVAVDDVHLLPGQAALQLPQAHHRVAGLYHLNGDAHFRRVLGEIPLAEAEQLGIDILVQFF